jgi:hypothetical protein
MSDEKQSDHDRQEKQPTRKKRRKRLPSVVEPKRSSGQRQSRSKQHPAPDSDACLSALGQLPGLIAMGLVTTAQANAIRGVYNTILQHQHRSRAGGDQQQLDDVHVMEVLRTNPGMLSMLEPLLTDEQIAAVMEEVKDDKDGQT